MKTKLPLSTRFLTAERELRDAAIVFSRPPIGDLGRLHRAALVFAELSRKVDAP